MLKVPNVSLRAINKVFQAFCELCGDDNSWTGKGLVQELKQRAELSDASVGASVRVLRSLGVIAGPEIKRTQAEHMTIIRHRWRLLRPDARIVIERGYFRLDD